MKKYKILFLIIAIITLCSVLTACNDPKTAYISFQLDEEFTVEWYNDEPVFEGFPYPSAYLISHKEKPVAILYDFESTSADGPSLNQTKGSKAQTLKFTMFTGHQGKAQPSVVLKVNGKTVEHTVAVFETMQYTEDSADQGWVFYYEKGGYTDSVVLSFEGLLAQPTYLLTFDTNGGTDVVALREHSGNAITAPDDPTKDGYTFDGWFIDDECKNAFEFDVMPASNTTIYAKWNPEQNEVQFNLNYQGSEIDATQDVAYGSTAVRPDNPVRKGYTFDGWYTTPDYDGAAFDFGTLIEESMVLYAKWSEIATDGLLFEEHGSDYKVTGYEGTETEVYIPSQHDGKLVFIIDEGAFEFNKNITYVSIPDTVVTIEIYAFNDCTSLESVTIGSGVTDIREGAFSGCTSLTSVTIGNGVTDFGYGAFYDCENLTEFLVNENNTNFTSINGALYNKEITEIVLVPVSITSITLPDSVTSIGSYAFHGCKELSEITLGDGINSIGSGAFLECIGLTSVTIPSGVTSIGEHAFANCAQLASVTIPDSVTSIGAHAFANCAQLASVTIPDGVTRIGYNAFAYCTSLTSVIIPDSVVIIDYMAFRDCTNLASVVVGDGVIRIEGDAFFNCTSLVSVTLGNSVEIINGAFVQCTSLISITIPDSVKTIAEWAFSSCTGLTSVIIGDGVEKIERNAFNNCSALQDVYYKGTESDWNSIAIEYLDNSLKEATRYYYSETEPALNEDGTDYDDNYWRYVDGAVVVWEME